MARQQVLDRDEPPRLSVVLGGAVLRHTIGDRLILRDQLEYLAMLASRPHIDIWILPFNAAAHAGPTGTFKIFQLPAPYSTAGHVETMAGGVYVEAGPFSAGAPFVVATVVRSGHSGATAPATAGSLLRRPGTVTGRTPGHPLRSASRPRENVSSQLSSPYPSPAARGWRGGPRWS